MPTEAPVVAERLRSITGNRYDSCIDRNAGPAFFGKIKDNSFRIRRNVGFKPKLLPAADPGTDYADRAELKASVAAVALAWVQNRPGVGSTIVGARTVEQLEANLQALELRLTPEQRGLPIVKSGECRG